jgi:DNA-binding CsgD family transcriptional regulator
VLYGREREWARLLDLVEQAQRGSAATVVVRGEPGVGKSALLDALADELGDTCVLRTQGFETEAPLAYAALHALLRPLARLRAVLPEPQARALRVAFGEEDGPVVEPFLMGVATLSLLTAAAEERLVVCLVEDAHWLDPASADALVFAARRLGADRVVMVFAVREGAAREFRPDGLAEMSLRGLEPTAARALLRHQVGELLSEEVSARLVSQTGGNPLALVELSEELTPDQRRGVAPVPAGLLITGRVERVFLDRCRRLPPPVQSVLLLAAADDTGRLSTVKDAAASLGLKPEAVAAALDSQLLVAEGETVRVRHPLVRSAVYQSAGHEERRRVHRALAEALPGDPDRQAWHRAGAAEGPDEGVVEALVGAGSRAERRGGYVAALAAYERAASLSARDASRAECLWGAARNAWACGRAAQARTHLAGAAAIATDPVVRADLARLRARIEVYVGSATDAHRIFVEGAHAAHEADPHRALEMAVAAAVLRTYGADSGATLPAGDVLAERSADDTPRTACLKQLLPSMTRAADGDWAGAVAALDPALAEGDVVDDLDVLGNLGNAALQLGDDEAQRRFYGLMLSRARDNGAVMVVIYALQRRAFSLLVGGDWADLRSSAEEGLSLSRSVGQRALTASSLAWLTLLAALQDRPDYADTLAELDEAAAGQSLGILTDPVHDLTRWAQGTRAAAAGDHVGALHHLGRLRLSTLSRLAAVDRIDAAVRAGEPQLARAWTDELAPYASGTGRAWALASVHYGAAMTADPETADALFQQALAQQALAQRAGAGRPYDEARTRLAYGEWLRRHQRRVDARQHLRQALETFRDLRATALADRAAQELRASGETARKRDPSTLVALTPMELKVAQLVSSGLSNKEVAAQCWVSPRTVAFHLRNVFAKAGVTSRGELAQLDLG